MKKVEFLITITKKKEKKVKTIPIQYMVEYLYIYGWDDAEWTVDDKPQRFATKKEAQKELNSFFSDIKEAEAMGNMEKNGHPRSDYRIVEA